MEVLQNVGLQKATGETREILENIKHAVGMVPKPLEMMVASPNLLKHYYNGIGYYQNHSSLDFGMLLFLRYLVAREMGFDGCIDFNGSILLKQGLNQNQLDEMVVDHQKIPLDEKERALVSFVVKGILGEQATPADMAHLKILGWSEGEVFDAVNHGFAMLTPGKMLEFFRLA